MQDTILGKFMGLVLEFKSTFHPTLVGRMGQWFQTPGFSLLRSFACNFRQFVCDTIYGFFGGRTIYFLLKLVLWQIMDYIKSLFWKCTTYWPSSLYQSILPLFYWCMYLNRKNQGYCYGIWHYKSLSTKSYLRGKMIYMYKMWELYKNTNKHKELVANSWFKRSWLCMDWSVGAKVAWK